MTTNDMTLHNNEATAAREQRLQWWRQARFGMFIHWSPATCLSGYWQGRPTNFCSEWIRHVARIPRADYIELVRNFQPRRFDPAEWVAVARQAGMKYMVFTAKHHDGFCFWDSEQTDFKITNTAAKRDVMQELTEECRRQRMPLGWYYSPRDWHHPDYLPHYSRLAQPGAAYKGWWGYAANPALGIEKDLDCGCPACVADVPVPEDRDAKQADLSRYLRFMRRQLEELVTRYGPAAVLWFDAQEHSPAVGGTADLIRFLRRLNPDLLINDRVATEPGWGDFAIHEWNIPQGLQPRPWESCLCLNGSWSFNALDLAWKPAAQLVRELCEIVSRGGNLLLNVGPDPDGVIPPASVERLQELGRWLRLNGEAIYDTDAGAFPPTGPLRFTRRGDTHYVIATEWPGARLDLPMLRLRPEAQVELLGVGTLLRWENQATGCSVRLPSVRPCDHAWVVRLTGVEAAAS